MNLLTALLLSSFLAVGAISTHDDLIKSDTESIVSIAKSTDYLSTLTAAVEAGDLIDILEGEGPFTVFAPTNEAFAALPAGTLETLLKPENKQMLVDILTYHVVVGEVMSGDLSDGSMAATVNGAKVKVGVSDKGVMINEASVTTADIKASNGVIHIIDKVILPPAMLEN